MGEVWQVVHKGTQELYALKMVNIQSALKVSILLDSGTLEYILYDFISIISFEDLIKHESILTAIKINILIFSIAYALTLYFHQISLIQ